MTPALTDLATRLADPDAFSTRTVDRIAYAHDTWPLALKAAHEGHLPYLPAAVVWPSSAAQVATTLVWAAQHRVPVTPYGGGSGIVGGALAAEGGVILDTKRMGRLLGIDAESLLVEAETGINGRYLEDRLNAAGYTLGHLPQSMMSGTLGGWLAHRAAGVSSTRYGKIEDLVHGLEVVLPSGALLRTRRAPRAAAGPDLRQLFVGAEGVLGVVTSATLAIRPLPEVRRWRAYACPSFRDGIAAIRQVLQRDLRPAIVRLYDPIEARPHLAAAGVTQPAALLIWGCEGFDELVGLEERAIERACARALALGPGPGERWWAHRLSTSGLLRTNQQAAGVGDALEVSATWADLPRVYEAMLSAMSDAVEANGQVYGHVSHVYPAGGNLYMIFHSHAHSPEAVPEHYQAVLAAAFGACLAHGGCLSHHHGVGLGKAAWFADEHGPAGLATLHAIQRALDPQGIMNPGKALHARSAL